jgi:hypothetical protein
MNTYILLFVNVCMYEIMDLFYISAYMYFMYVCIYVYKIQCLYSYFCILICILISMYVCVYAYFYVRMCIYFL